jgi:hypothetical protein
MERAKFFESSSRNEVGCPVIAGPDGHRVLVMMQVNGTELGA